MKESIGPKNPCEAPTHTAGCTCVGCRRQKPESCVKCPKITDDHFTPRSIAKIMGWNAKFYNGDTPEEQRLNQPSMNDPENHQWLSVACHRTKDLDTPLRGDVLRKQLRGVSIPLEVHQQIFEAGVIRPLDIFLATGAPMEPGMVYELPAAPKAPRQGGHRRHHGRRR